MDGDDGVSSSWRINPLSVVDRDVVLVPEQWDRDVGVARAVVALARLAEDQRPARVAVLLAQLRRMALPHLRDAVGLDVGLLAVAVALLGRGESAIGSLKFLQSINHNSSIRANSIAPRITGW